jgi:hypothetical protein
MSVRVQIPSILIWVMLSTLRAAGQEPEVLVELGRPRVFEGESVRYSVTLNHCEDSARPTMPKMTDIQVREAGVTVVRQTIFDGFKRVSIGGPRYEYVLTPQRSGEVTIPGPSVEVDGKIYRGQSLTLQVVAPNEQDLAVLEVTTSHSAVYPLQPFTLQLKIAIKGMPEPYTEEDPLRGTGDIPVLMIPWADDESLPEGIKPDSPAARWLKDLLPPSRRTVGFGINNIRLSSDDLFAMFTEQQRAMFRPEPRRIKRKDGKGRTIDYWEYVFERTLTGSKMGPMSFGPITLKGSFATRANPAGGVDVEDVYAVAKPVEVTVRDVPAVGRPDSYIGAIGKYEVEAELTPTTVKVGDPMTLSLRVHGRGTLDNAFAPKLEQMPAIAENFKIYEATEQSGEGERRFTYSLRPRRSDLKEFPSLELAYFDVDKEKYIPLKTPAIKIQVAESDRLANQDIAVSEKSTSPAPTIEAAGAGIFANITDSRQLYDERVNPNSWFISLGGMAAAFVICSFVTRQLHRQRSDPRHQRRRIAAKRAQNYLAEARRHSASGSRRETIDSLRAAITGLVADAVDSQEVSLTSRDLAQKLAAIHVPEAVIIRCQQLLDEFDAARYGEGVHSLEEQLQSADELLQDLLRELRKRKLAV